MALLTQAVTGTHDILPEECSRWQQLEARIRKICGIYQYGEIRTPMFEYTELFLRGIGETTDVVQKEMYTFMVGDRSITLRPEATASTVRSYLDNKMYGLPSQPVKLYYMGPMFRHDKPQAGRYRQFHQFGIEVLGTQAATSDAEIISLAYDFLTDLGLEGLNLYINSVGCPKCRPAYQEKLREYFTPHLEELCQDCVGRLDKNPLRLLDCKERDCQKLGNDAPKLLECLCEECQNHFGELKELLAGAGIPFTINQKLVRGLDYYTKTAFEIQYPPLSSQSAVCGGGRYDGLIQECGGDFTPSVGFAMGIERILIALDQHNLLPPKKPSVSFFVMPLGEKAKPKCFELVQKIRKLGISAEIDLMNRGVKGQMKQANRQNANWALLLGDNELEQGMITCKDMIGGDQRVIALADFENWIESLREEI